MSLPSRPGSEEDCSTGSHLTIQHNQSSQLCRMVAHSMQSHKAARRGSILTSGVTVPLSGLELNLPTRKPPRLAFPIVIATAVEPFGFDIFSKSPAPHYRAARPQC
ncbi:hypothetical protein AOLI_G00142240 [Acnodon oligacanthus]